MEKLIKNLISALAIVVLLGAFTLDVKSQEDECETVVVSGTKMNENPDDKFFYECMGEFADCTEVWITCPRVR